MWIILILVVLLLIIVTISFRDSFGKESSNRSFAKDIRPLFRDSDIETMKTLGLDLSSYNDVKNNAGKIYQRLANKSMPCDGGWSDANIDKFRRWMDNFIP